MTSQACDFALHLILYVSLLLSWCTLSFGYRKGLRLRIHIWFLNVTHKKLCSVKTDAGLDPISVGHWKRGVGSRMWRPESDRSVAKDNKSGNL